MIERIERTVVNWFHRLPRWLLFLLVFTLFLGPTPDTLGRIDGKFRPVATTSSLQVVGREDGVTSVVQHIEKDRECTFKSLAFYVVLDDGELLRIPWSNRDPEVNPKDDVSRPTGDNLIHLNVYTAAPLNRWRMRVRHDCGYWFDTLTILWPP